MISSNKESLSHKRSESEQVMHAHEDSNVNLHAFHSALNFSRTKSKEKKSDLTVSNEQYVEVNSPFRVNSIHSKGNERSKIR